MILSKDEKLSPSPHPMLQEITHEQWSEYSKKLLAFTILFFNRYGGEDVILPGGFSAPDIAQEVVVRVLDGSRQWHPEKHGDLLEYLIGQVKSITSHCLTSWSGKNEVAIKGNDEFTASEYLDKLLQDGDVAEHLHLASPEQIVLDKENLIERSDLLNLVIEAVDNDPELVPLLEAYLDGSQNFQRRYIAEKLGTTPEQITNLWKKLKRRIRAINLEKTSK
jgi:hypothetical protein